MALWNFCHNVIGMHMYYVLAIAVGLIMAVAGLIRHGRRKKLDKDNEKKLAEISEAVQASDAAEGGPAV